MIWSKAVSDVEQAARYGSNIMPAVLRAVDADATVGEIGAALRRASGVWDFPLW